MILRILKDISLRIMKSKIFPLLFFLFIFTNGFCAERKINNGVGVLGYDSKGNSVILVKNGNFYTGMTSDGNMVSGVARGNVIESPFETDKKKKLYLTPPSLLEREIEEEKPPARSYNPQPDFDKRRYERRTLSNPLFQNKQNYNELDDRNTTTERTHKTVVTIPNNLFNPKDVNEIPFGGSFLPETDVPGKDIFYFPRPIGSVRTFFQEQKSVDRMDYRIVYYVRSTLSDVLGVLSKRFDTEGIKYSNDRFILVLTGNVHGSIQLQEFSLGSDNIVLIIYLCSVNKN